MPFSIDQQKVQWRVVDGEAVLVNVESSYYYGLNKTGTFVWTQLVEKPATASDIAERLAAEYGIEIERAMADVQAVVAHLVEEGLVRET